MKKRGIINCDLSARDADIIPPINIPLTELKDKIGPGEVPYAVVWDTLSEKQKDFQATKMAIHAAMITRMDNEIGRIIEQLKKMDVYENTLVIFVSDNGASAEQIVRGDGHDPEAPLGSPDTYLCLGPGWSTAANTPFRLHKRWNHEGGISTPLIAHWPNGIQDRGKFRHDPSHFIDILPTCMDIAGLDFPKATPNGEAVPTRPGKSLVPAFKKGGALKHEYLWWAHANSRAFREGNWKISARQAANREPGPWQLYDLSVDRCEMNNLSSQNPEKVKKLASEWHNVADGFRKDLSG
jgi:arylsulfatase